MVDSIAFVELSAREIATIGPLMLSLASLCLLFVLLRGWSKGAEVTPVVSGVEPLEVGAQAVSEVAAAQVELRELVQGFSCLAEQVLRAFDQHQALSKPPDAQGRAVQLLELGLTPTEVARATGLALGEVALLVNLHRMKAAKGRLAATPPCDAGDLPDRVRDGNGRSSQEEIEVDRKGGR